MSLRVHTPTRHSPSTQHTSPPHQRAPTRASSPHISPHLPTPHAFSLLLPPFPSSSHLLPPSPSLSAPLSGAKGLRRGPSRQGAHRVRQGAPPSVQAPPEAPPRLHPCTLCWGGRLRYGRIPREEQGESHVAWAQGRGSAAHMPAADSQLVAWAQGEAWAQGRGSAAHMPAADSPIPRILHASGPRACRRSPIASLVELRPNPHRLRPD